MSEERYLKITSCKECPHHGHISCGSIIIFVCGFPENMLIEQLPSEMISGICYPIIHEGKFSEEVHIPFWCKLNNIAYYHEVPDKAKQPILTPEEVKKHDELLDKALKR